MAKSKSITPVFPQDRPIRHVALYGRVSTLNGQQDPEMQLSELREYAIRRGLSIHQEYVDAAKRKPSTSDNPRFIINRRFDSYQHTYQFRNPGQSSRCS